MSTIVVFMLILLAQNTPVNSLPPHIQGKLVFTWYDDELYTSAMTDPIQPVRLGTGITGHNPAWSPDGTRIAFAYSPDSAWSDIYVINADGSGLQQLTDADGIDFMPRWSPDGRHIAFESDRDDQVNDQRNFEIYTMNADGSGQTRLTDAPTNEMHPVWSPDGTHIAFQSFRDGNVDIYVMNADGSGQIRLTDAPGYDGNVKWGSNNQLTFRSDRSNPDRDPQIFLMNADGSDVRQLSDNLVDYGGVQWLPDGNLIYLDFLDLMYLDIRTGMSYRLVSWFPEGILPGAYDIFVEDD